MGMGSKSLWALGLGVALGVAPVLGAQADEIGKEGAPAKAEAAGPEEAKSDDSLMRFMFEVNKGIDTLFIRPVATLYQGLTPPEAQEGIHNVVNTARAPIIMGNDLLQGEFDRAGVTFERTIINTTQGFLGWNDEAAKQGLHAHDEDFGQTMGAWGVEEGDYVVLPIVGPSTSRDAVGAIIDFVTMPPGVGAIHAMDKRARMDQELEAIEKTSVDHYAAIRSLYLQNRRYEVSNQKSPETQAAGNDFPTLSAEDLDKK
ncbi:MAG: VacJ family lipoprotein [Magnetospirillum sp. WYHS-4]